MVARPANDTGRSESEARGRRRANAERAKVTGITSRVIHLLCSVQRPVVIILQSLCSAIETYILWAAISKTGAPLIVWL